MDFQIVQMDPPRRGGIIEINCIYCLIRNKWLCFCRKKTLEIDDHQILPHFVRVRLYRMALTPIS